MGSTAPPPTKAPLGPGDRLDRYELLCELAQGGMGTVWLARQTGKLGFERMVALKTILPTFEADRQFFDMFLDEARIAARVDHENVARTIDIGEDRGILFHAMELVDGLSVRKLFRDVEAAEATFPLPIALRISADLCAGLHAVHELRGADGQSLEVVHRDVSPQNVLLTTRGTVKLIDFGVAKARERTTEETAAGTLKGKLEYMSPEQAGGGGKVDRRADIYSVGATLYELLCGIPVTNAEDGRQLLALHELVTGEPYEPLPRTIPALVRAIVDRALAHDAEARYRTADELRKSLEQAMEAIGQTATSDDVAATLQRFSGERLAQTRAMIDGALRAAQAKSSSAAPSSSAVPSAAVGAPPLGRSVDTAPLVSAAGLLPPRLDLEDDGDGPNGTKIMTTQPPPATVVIPRDRPDTGSSLRALGAAPSAAPPQPMSSGARAFGTAIVLALVALLGLVVGVVVSAPSASAPVPATLPTASVAPVTAAASAPRAPPGEPAAGAAASSGAVINVPLVTMGVGTVIGASDGGAPPPTRATAKRPPPPPPAPRPAGAKKSDPESDYGF